MSDDTKAGLVVGCSIVFILALGIWAVVSFVGGINDPVQINASATLRAGSTATAVYQDFSNRDAFIRECESTEHYTRQECIQMAGDR